MKLFHHAQGPRVKATFFTNKGVITSIALAEHNQDGCCWQIETNSSASGLINQWMEGYCQKKSHLPKLPLLWPSLPPFTMQVLKTLQAVPFGETLSYQQLASNSLNPKAYRATGSACGRNPFPLVIPCHRVLAAGHKIGGFAFSLGVKKELLSFENHSL